jgi:hypothetical protein
MKMEMPPISRQLKHVSRIAAIEGYTPVIRKYSRPLSNILLQAIFMM